MVGTAGDHDVADPGAYGGLQRPEPAAPGRLVTGEHVGPVAEHRPPRRHHVVDRAAAAVEVPEPCLPADQGDALAQLGDLVDVDPPVRRAVEHAVVGDHDQPGRGREGLAQLLGLGVDHGQLLEPLAGRDAEAVAGPVEVAVVHVGQRGPGRSMRRRRRRSAPPPGRRRRTPRRAGRRRSARWPGTRACSRWSRSPRSRPAARRPSGGAATGSGRRTCSSAARSAAGRCPGSAR